MTRQVTRTAAAGENMVEEIIDGFDVDLHVDPDGLAALVDVLADRVKARLLGDYKTLSEVPDVRIAKARVILLEDDER